MNTTVFLTVISDVLIYVLGNSLLNFSLSQYRKQGSWLGISHTR